MLRFIALGFLNTPIATIASESWVRLLTWIGRPCNIAALPFLGDEQFVDLRRQHDARDRFPFVVAPSFLRRNGHRIVRDAVKIIDRPVERVNDPAHVGLGVTRRRFLAENAVVGIVRENDPGNELLRELVDLQLDIVVRGLVDVQRRPEILFQ